MARRSTDTELEFGSDSFLDVISNMVGILLILILMAAYRARSKPVDSTDIAKAVDGAVVAPEPTQPQAIVSTPPMLSIPASSALTPDNKAFEDEQLAELNRLLAQIASSQSQINYLERDLKRLDTNSAGKALKLTQDQHLFTSQELEKLNAALAKALADRERLNNQSRTSTTDLDQLRSQLTRLNEELAKLEAQRSKKEALHHKVMPIGQREHGARVLFRVSRGKVSEVPVEEMLDRLKDKIAGNRDWLLRHKQLQGQIGPIEGYIARYSVTFEEFGDRIHGAGWGQVKLDRIAFEPTAKLLQIEEPIDQALGEDGLFRSKLAEMSADRTIEVWVPNDSFGDYRQLLTFAQRQGFQVAGSPMPTGMPYVVVSEGGLTTVAQ